MNHIYKTILNKRTGEIQVVSEKASTSCKSQKGGNLELDKVVVDNRESNDKAIKGSSLQKSKLAFSVGLALTTLFSSSLFAATTYTGDIDQLVGSSSIGGQFDQLIGSSTDQGVTELDGTATFPIQSGAAVTIDYATGATPNFILAGYAPVNADDDPQNAVASDNSITLKQGDINGNVYAGLAHATTVFAPFDCASGGCTSIKEVITVENKTLASNNNAVNILDENSIAVAGNMYAGSSEINIEYGDLTNATAEVDADISIRADSTVSSNILDANTNNLSILGQNNSFNDISAGSTRINIDYGDLTGGTMSEGIDGNVDVSVNASTRTFQNTLNANENKISFNSDANDFNDISAGSAGINIHYADIKGGSSVHDLNIQGASANATASTDATFSENRLNAEENNISISGQDNIFHEISAGSAGMSIDYGKIKGGDATELMDVFAYENADASANTEANALSNKLNANTNSITVSGQNNYFNDIRIGSAEVLISYADFSGGTANADVYATSNATTLVDVTDNALNVNTNNITVSGQDNIFNDITIGSAGINISYADLSGSEAYASAYTDINADANVSAQANVTGNILSAKENNLSVSGSNNVFNDITTGTAGINIHYGNITSGNASINAANDVEVNANTIAEVNASDNTLNGEANKVLISGSDNVFNDISAGSVGINISYDNIFSGNAFVNADAGVDANANVNVNALAAKNTLDANTNNISISNQNNHFNDITVGSAGINLNYGDIQGGTADTNVNANANIVVSVDASSNILNANANKITIAGQDHSFNDITAGYAGLNLKLGAVVGGLQRVHDDGSSGDASLTIDASGTALSASNNSISLEGSSTINGSLYAGYIDFNIEYGAIKSGDNSDATPDINLTGTKAFATNNTMTIEGSHGFTNPDASIYGGYLSANAEHQPESYDVFTGNTLNYNNRTPIEIGALGNFQTYNFSLNPELANTETALITAKNVNLGSNKSNTSADSVVASDIYVVGIQSGKLVATDSKFILIQADKDQLTGVGQGHTSKGVAQQGISLLYDVKTTIDYDNNQVTATILNSPTRVNPQLKALLEGNLSGLMLLTRSADELSNNLFSAINDQNHQRGLVPFIIMSGNHIRYDTGSDIKSDGALLTGGLSFQDEQWTAGVFIENGWDSYKTSNRFEDAADIHGKGHNRFNGIGIYGRYDFNNGWYADGTLRGGRLHTAFSSDDLRNAITGERAEYDISSSYYGVHLTGGYMLALDQQNDLDISLKYLWSGTQSQDLVIAGDPIRFNKLNSQRLRLNAENNYKINPEFTLLTGLGYEYEFDGKAGGTTYDLFDIDQASVKGSTGIATLGVRYEPKSNDHFSMDLKGSGFFGKREGGSAMLHLKYAF